MSVDPNPEMVSETIPAAQEAVTFSKSELLEGALFRGRRDLLTVLLSDRARYTIPQVVDAMNQFMNEKEC